MPPTKYITRYLLLPIIEDSRLLKKYRVHIFVMRCHKPRCINMLVSITHGLLVRSCGMSPKL